MTTKKISPKQAFDWLVSGEAILIDVREGDEFQAERIVYAYSVPLAKVADVVNNTQIPKDRKIIFQCFKGKRGEKACLSIPEADKSRIIYNMEGGIDAWKNAGLPTISSRGGISIFRQVQMIVGSLILLATIIGFSGLIGGFFIAGLFGAALAFAGLTGFCGLGLLLAKMPWNKM